MKKLLPLLLLGLAASAQAESQQDTIRNIFNAESLCYELAWQFSAGHPEFVQQHMDYEAFQARIVNASPLLLEPANRLPANFFAKVQPNSFPAKTHFHVAHFEESPGQARCRLTAAVSSNQEGLPLNEGLQTLLLYMNTGVGKQTRIVDWSWHGDHDAVSVRMRTLLEDTLKSEKEGRTEDTRLLRRFIGDLSRQRENLYSSFRALPPRYRSQPFYIALTANLMPQDRPAEYLDILGQLFQALPEKQAYAGNMFEYYQQKQQPRDALTMLEAMKARMSDDPALEYLAALSAQQQNDRKGYYNHLLEALRQDPSEEAPYWLLLHTFVKQENYADAMLAMDVLQKHFFYDFTKLASKEQYRKLATSPEYQRWVSKNPKPASSKS